MGELSLNRTELSKIKNNEDTPLSKSLINHNNLYIDEVGNYFSAIVSSFHEISNNINPEELYVVKFSREQLEKFQNGEIDFQKTADRKALLPNFVTKGTNNDIVSKARLEKLVLDNPDALHKVVSNVNQLVNAQKINHLGVLVGEVKQISLDVKQGQMNDRRAKILGAESTINQALLLDDNNPQKQILLLNSIIQLNEGREALIKEFEDNVNIKISIPDSKIRLLFKSIFDDKFNEDISSSFEEINDSFSYIVKAGDLLVKTYSLTGNSEMVATIYSPVKFLVEKNKDYISKLVELQDIPTIEEQRQLKWCMNPGEFISQIESTSLMDNDIITLEFNGEELLNGEWYAQE